MVVFDKTGTLTRGEFRVVDVATDGSLSAKDALPIAAAVERDPSTRLRRDRQERGGAATQRAKADQFEAIPGHGVKAVRPGQRVLHGRTGDAEASRAHAAGRHREAADRAAARGQAAIYPLTSTAAVAAFAVADAVRPESREAIQRLHE
jgi:P-type Cu2+ transporter